MRLVVALSSLLLLLSCAAGSADAESDENSPCPLLARDADAVIARAVAPEGGERLLCRYDHRSDGGLRLRGVEPISEASGDALYAEFENRSLAMVDCQPRPAMPLFAVVDRDGEGRSRVVTVDLGLCGTVLAEVAGKEEYGLAGASYQSLLTRTWAPR